jgi:hypothetical protein
VDDGEEAYLGKAAILPHIAAMRRMFRLPVLVALIAAALYLLPQGKRAAELHMAANDPAKLADLQLDRVFTTDYANREIASALDADDVELAESFIALADERNVKVRDDLKARLAEAQSPANQRKRMAGSFGRGFATGETSDTAGLVGAATGDLIGWGDVRDLARESWHAATGQEVNKFLAGMSVVGLGVTAWTISSFGAAAPVREGVTVVKAAARGGRLSEDFLKSAARLFTTGGAERAGAALADLGTVQTKAGTRAAIAGLREADSVGEISKLTRLATARGRGTLAVLKTLGRDSFVLGAVAVTAYGWLLGVVINILLIFAAINGAFMRFARRLWSSGEAWRATRISGSAVAAGAASV